MNKKIFEPFADLVDDVLINLNAVINNGTENVSVNDDAIEGNHNTVFELRENPAEGAIMFDEPFSFLNSVPILPSDDELNCRVRSLNTEQKQIFIIVHH